MFIGQVQAETEELNGFKDWMIYKQETAKGRICFMSSVPKKLRGDYDRANRGETRVFVSHGPGKAERDVVSVLAGYRYKKQSEVDFSIDKKSATLFTLENRAWSQGPEEVFWSLAASYSRKALLWLSCHLVFPALSVSFSRFGDRRYQSHTFRGRLYPGNFLLR